ncbi:MAG: hypothetical protein V1706_12650 [Pseudomonadota bacterium]
MTDQLDRKFIPSLREGIDVVKMIFFQDLKQSFARKFAGEDSAYPGMLAGAVMNELFATPNPQERFQLFAEENRVRIVDELKNVAGEFPELCILLTDALRMHFLCNHQEGIDDGNKEILKKAKECGILLAERDVPLPKGFMALVYQVGRARGIIAEQKLF